ncbi:hypothetical protein SAMN05216304_11234 [Bosea sp. OK403]|nr:hypothetical protein SAMN05216304_11234 [Bosea sp. OK403]
MGTVFVVLAEPGAGKTELLKALAGMLQANRIRASIFQNKPELAGKGPLVIDAMDEVARIDTIATDKIIAMASEAQAATVVFAGRSAEWDRSRTTYVEQCFGAKPVVVHLQPFNEDERRQLFESKFPREDFEAFAAEVHRFGVGPLLGNPQFLILFGEAYIESGCVFTSKAKIFADAIRRLAHEANTERPKPKSKPPLDAIIAVAGEVFAKLLLSGATGIATVESLGNRDFPYINSLCRDASNAPFLIDTRLLRPSGDPEEHEPVHRIVAEYCAASYLAGRIEDPKDRLSLERVLAVVAPNGVTRDELRGMVGWMAALGHQPLQLRLIELDPYAVLANGDPSQLTTAAKRALLSALDKLTDLEPLFRRSDTWRRFNVGQFFTSDIFDPVRAILRKPGQFRTLVLELLIDTDASDSLVPELSLLVRDTATDSDTRKWVGAILLAAGTFEPAVEFNALFAEGSATSLEIVARWVTKRGVESIGADKIVGLLEKLSRLYGTPNRRHLDGTSRYFIDVLVRSFTLAEVTNFLDALTTGFACTCAPKHAYACTCRYGKSKILGRLLDRYFELAEAGPHDPVRIWQWIRSLHFQGNASTERSASVKHLVANDKLRRELQRRAVKGLRGNQAQEAVSDLYSSHGHSGLHMYVGDPDALSQYAFDHHTVDVWGSLLSGHNFWGKEKGPNALRATQRAQSKFSPDFMRLWARRERARREYSRDERRLNHIRGRKKRADKEAAVEANNRAHLRANLAEIEAGRHGWWLTEFTRAFLYHPHELEGMVDDPETPLRALRNCFPFVEPHIPTVERLGQSKSTNIAEILLAALIVLYRDGVDLTTLDPRMLAAAKTEATSSYPVFKDSEADGEAFEAALDAALFKESGSAETFLRAYIEPQLAQPENAPQRVYWSDNKPAFHDLRARLPMEWLERFPQMPEEAMRPLFGMASKYGRREDLIALIDRRCGDPLLDSGKNTEDDTRARGCRKFWHLNAVLYRTPDHDAAWQELKTDPKAIFGFEGRLGRMYEREDDDHPPIAAETIYEVMDAFVPFWAKVPLSSSWGTGDPEDQAAYRFLRDCIWKIAEDAPERRIEVLDRMLPDARFEDYREAMLTMRAEAQRKLALQDFRAPRPSEISKILEENDVASVEDLRALMVEQLEELQRWLNGSETDPLDAFYDDDKRVDENNARNRIVDQLQGQMKALGLSIVIERHMAGGNRCDITASAILEGRNRLLVTEVKGQWNDELYTAAAAQLDQRYAIHPDAARQGVYLALWFGNGEKVNGLVDASVTSAGDLKARIVDKMTDELKARVNVVVLDLSRPTQLPKPPKKTSAKKAAAKT